MDFKASLTLSGIPVAKDAGMKIIQKGLDMMNVLIIGPDADGVEQLADILASWHHTVYRAPTAAQAIALSKQSFFEVILMELVLDGAPAYEIIPDLKLYNPGVSVITMTGHSTPELERQARERGISFYMGKPVKESQLKQIFDQLAVFHLNYGEWRKVTLF